MNQFKNLKENSYLSRRNRVPIFFFIKELFETSVSSLVRTPQLSHRGMNDVHGTKLLPLKKTSASSSWLKSSRRNKKNPRPKSRRLKFVALYMLSSRILRRIGTLPMSFSHNSTGAQDSRKRWDKCIDNICLQSKRKYFENIQVALILRVFSFISKCYT